METFSDNQETGLRGIARAHGGLIYIYSAAAAQLIYVYIYVGQSNGYFYIILVPS